MSELIRGIWVWRLPLLKACVICLLTGASTFQTAMSGVEWSDLTSTEKTLVVNGVFISMGGALVAFLDKSMHRISEGKTPLETGTTQFMSRPPS